MAAGANRGREIDRHHPSNPRYQVMFNDFVSLSIMYNFTSEMRFKTTDNMAKSETPFETIMPAVL